MCPPFVMFRRSCTLTILFVISAAFVLVSSSSSSSLAVDDRPDAGTETPTRRYPSVWLANLFYETLVDFTVHADVGSTACRQQTLMYVKHLANDSLWAVQSE